MSEGDEDQYLDWFDKEYTDSDKENDPKKYPFNILAAKGARGNTKRPVIKSSSKKPDNLPKFIDSDVASTSAITSSRVVPSPSLNDASTTAITSPPVVPSPRYILLASSNKSNKYVSSDVETTSNISSDRSLEDSKDPKKSIKKYSRLSFGTKRKRQGRRSTKDQMEHVRSCLKKVSETESSPSSTI